MNKFLKFSLCYFILATMIAILFRANAWEAVGEALRLVGCLTDYILFATFTLICLGLIGNATVKTKAPRDTVMDAVKAAVALTYFKAAFVIAKTSLPFIVPFYADPAFAKADMFLHIGEVPWEMAHSWGRILPMDWLAGAYLYGWTWTAAFLPVIFAALDSNQTRVRRMLILYAFAWIVLGNLLALAGMSAGPIYFDRIYGGDQFAALPGSFLSDGPNMQTIRTIQENLWLVYSEFAQAMGSGISAFPSVHVAIATLTAIYLYERSPYLLPIALAWIAAILFMSVYTGYHYAIDGYISIVLVTGAWQYLRRKDRIVEASATFVPAYP